VSAQAARKASSTHTTGQYGKLTATEIAIPFYTDIHYIAMYMLI
jgi:hypothetical protein